MSANEIAELMRQGIEAARAGDTEAARSAFEQVVALDDQNEKGWFWLASVLEDETRKRVALSTVLLLNPNNERARRILDQLEAQERERIASTEIIPGVTRRTFLLLIGGAAVVIFGVLGIFLLISINNARVASDANATRDAIVREQEAVAATATARAVAVLQTQAAITPTAFDLAEVSSPLPPTWTPTAEASPTPTRPALAFPPNLGGRLSAWAGRDFDVNGYLPIGTISLSDGQFTPAGDQEGRDVSLSPNGQRLAYTRFQPAVFDTLIEAVNINGTDPESFDARWRDSLTLFSPHQPAFGPNAESVVFVARPEDGQTDQIFVVTLGQLPPGGDGAAVSPIRRVTNDESNYSQPQISPDGFRIVAVRDNVNDATAGADLVVIDLSSGAQIPVTNDRGAFIESSPQWSPDGLQIVYAAAPESDPENADIAVRFASGQGTPTLVARDPGNDITPAFSPDGRYVAFSSNRSGVFDVYVYDLQMGSLYQLTNTDDPEYIGGWR